MSRRAALPLALLAVIAILAPGAIAAAALPGYGNWFAGDSLANLPIGDDMARQVDYRWRPEADGSVNAGEFFFIWTKNSNGTINCYSGSYACGTGGVIEVTVQTDNGAGKPSGVVLARGVDSNPAGAPNYYHKITFDRAAAVTASRIYHFVFRNISSAPASNYVSTDEIASGGSQVMPVADLATLYKDGSNSSSVAGTWNLTAHTPIFTTFYTDGTRHGPGAPYINVARSQTGRTISGSSRIAESATPKVTRTVSGAALRTLSGSGTLSLRLKNAAGSDLASCTAVAQAGGWKRCSFGKTVTLAAGTLYRMVANSSGSYSVTALQEGAAFTSTAQFSDGTAQYTTDNGATWSSYTGFDWSFYLVTP